MKKLAVWIIILVLIIAGVFGYNRYMYGNLKIDRELVSDENLNLLADNWEKLDLYVFDADESENEQHLQYADDQKIASLTIRTDEPSSDASLEILATYSCSGLREFLLRLRGLVSGNRHSEINEIINTVHISNSRIYIFYYEQNTQASADNFEAWFREMLEIAQS